MKVAQEHVTAMIDLSLEITAGYLAKSVAEDKLVKTREQLRQARNSRVVSTWHRGDCASSWRQRM